MWVFVYSRFPVCLSHISDATRWSEAFTHHLLTLGPERLGMLRIKRIGPDAGAYRADQPFGDLGHLAILAIAAAHFLGRGNEGGPDGRRRPLRNRLPLEGWLALGRQLGVDLLYDLIEFLGIHMAAELGLDPSRVERRPPYPARPMPAIGHPR